MEGKESEAVRDVPGMEAEEMKDFITAILIRPGEPPKMGTQRNRLKELQDRVGGYIEGVTLEPGLVVICNEEGLINDMKYCATIGGHQFFGPILIVGADGTDFTDVPEEKFAKYYKWK